MNDSGTPGFEVLNPILIDGENYLLNRGWIPFEKKDTLEINILDQNNIEGTLKTQGRKNIFKPDNDLKNNIWFSINLEDLKEATGEQFNEFVIFLEDNQVKIPSTLTEIKPGDELLIFVKPEDAQDAEGLFVSK